MKYAIKHLFHIDASKESVFEAISTISGLSNWWTVKTSGSTALHGAIQFNFGDMAGPEMRVTEHVPGEKVAWECVASTHGWTGHQFVFSLDENEGKTRVRFSHSEWDEAGDFYANCNFSWGRYLESLRQYCQTGKGKPFGGEN